MRRIVIAVSVALSFASPSSADSLGWKEVDGWTVRMEPSLGNACYIATAYEDGTVLRIGFSLLEETQFIYFALGNRNWKSLEKGKKYPIEIQFDDSEKWKANAEVVNGGKANFLSIFTRDFGFLDDFARNHSVRAVFKGKEIAALRLNGSASATRELMACQAAVTPPTANDRKPDQKDPFQTPPDSKSTKDPFDL